MSAMWKCGVVACVLMIGFFSVHAQTRANFGQVMKLVPDQVLEMTRSCMSSAHEKRNNTAKDVVDQLNKCTSLHELSIDSRNRIALIGAEVGIGGALAGGLSSTAAASVAPYVAAFAGLIATGVCIGNWVHCKSNALSIAKKVRVYVEASFFSSIALARYALRDDQKARDATKEEVGNAIENYLENDWVNKVRESDHPSNLKQYSTNHFNHVQNAARKKVQQNVPMNENATPPPERDDKTPQSNAGRKSTCSKKFLDRMANRSNQSDTRFQDLLNEANLLLKLLTQEVENKYKNSDKKKKQEMRKKIEQLRNEIKKAECLSGINSSFIAGKSPEQMLLDVRWEIMNGEFKNLILNRINLEMKKGRMQRLTQNNIERYVAK